LQFVKESKALQIELKCFEYGIVSENL